MPSFALTYRVAGAFEGAASVRPATSGGAFALRVRLRCTRCSEDQAKVSVVDNAWAGDEAKTEIPGSKGLASLVQRCACGAVFTLDVTSKADAVEPFTAEMAGASGGAGAGAEGAFLASLECRGCEPVAFEAGGGWTVVGAGGTEFEGADLDKDDFAEYDESGEGTSVVVGAVVGSFTLEGSGGGRKGKR
jgi:hypothetical protein